MFRDNKPHDSIAIRMGLFKFAATEREELLLK